MKCRAVSATAELLVISIVNIFMYRPTCTYIVWVVNIWCGNLLSFCQKTSFHIYAVCKAALKVPIATAPFMQMTVHVVSCLFLLFIRHFVMWIYYIYGHRLEICMLHIVWILFCVLQLNTPICSPLNRHLCVTRYSWSICTVITGTRLSVAVLSMLICLLYSQ